MNVNLFGNRLFADVNYIIWCHTGLDWATFTDWFLMRRAFTKDPQEECPAKVQAEMGVLPLQAKACQGRLPPPEAGRGRKDSLLEL